MKEKYEKAIEDAKNKFEDILAGKEILPLDELNKRRLFVASLNPSGAYMKLWFSVNRYFLYAAAVILLLLSSMVFVPFGTSVNNIPLISDDITIKPENGVVQLKLSSGEIVPLDSIETIGDTLLRDSGVNIDNDNSLLSYQSGKISDIREETISEEESAEYTDKSIIEYNELYIPKGRSYSILLSDGSKIWVNAESTVKYPVNFSSSERRVVVSGEAYFDVVKDSKRPFIVETSEYDVMVTGTSFNVCAYEEDDIVATTLVSGSVMVSSQGQETSIKPGEQISYDKRSGEAVVEEVDVELYTLWIDNYLKLNHMPMEELFKILKRRYDIEVYYTNSDIKEKTFSGKIPLNDNLNIILNQISTVSDITFDIEKRLVVVRYKD